MNGKQGLALVLSLLAPTAEAQRAISLAEPVGIGAPVAPIDPAAATPLAGEELFDLARLRTTAVVAVPTALALSPGAASATTAAASAVAVGGVTAAGLTASGGPVLYELQRWLRHRKAEATDVAFHFTQVTAPLTAFLAVSIPSVMAVANLDSSLPYVVAVLSWVTARASVQFLAESRGHFVHEWQASHDQKYRVDTNTGRLKDIRGHKYGEDRYDRFVSGPVRAGERLTWTTLSTAAGAAAILLKDPEQLATYMVALTVLLAAADAVDARKARRKT